LKKDSHVSISQTKMQAFEYMDQLEGWCTKNKASILMDIIFMLKPKILVEIGVWGGKSLVPMAYALKVNQSGKIYGIDPWSNAESMNGMEGINLEWWGKVDHEKVMRGLQSKIIEFGLDEQIELIRSTSEQAPPIPSIDILHIDGNHSELAAKIDVLKWVPLVRKGGIIIFDDTTWGSNLSAVEWLNEHCVKLVEFNESNDWGIWINP
jgi:predicted O-methyltransferase YrrM